MAADEEVSAIEAVVIVMAEAEVVTAVVEEVSVSPQ